MSDDPEPRDSEQGDPEQGAPAQVDEERDGLPSDPEAPGTYVDDDSTTDVAEPNEPG